MSHNHLYLQFQGIQCFLLVSVGTRHTYKVSIQSDKNSYTYKIKINLLKEFLNYHKTKQNQTQIPNKNRNKRDRQLTQNYTIWTLKHISTKTDKTLQEKKYFETRFSHSYYELNYGKISKEQPSLFREGD